jgi:hypothetical protein
MRWRDMRCNFPTRPDAPRPAGREKPGIDGRRGFFRGAAATSAARKTFPRPVAGQTGPGNHAFPVLPCAAAYKIVFHQPAPAVANRLKRFRQCWILAMPPILGRRPRRGSTPSADTQFNRIDTAYIAPQRL